MSYIAQRSSLRVGPWCWPDPIHNVDFRRAQVESGLGGPPPLAPGNVALVSVRPPQFEVATLWALAIPPATGATSSVSVFKPDSLEAWKKAAAALPRCLPLLWHVPPAAEVNDLRALRLANIQTGTDTQMPESALEGQSFGLAFLLAQASLALQIPLKGDFVASAEVDADGRIRPVDSVGKKVQVIIARAPGVRRFLVATENRDEAVAAAEGARLEIVCPTNGAEAISETLAEPIYTYLARLNQDPVQRQGFIRHLFDLALLGRKSILDWTPVENTAGRILQYWKGLTAIERARMEFVLAIAARHERNEGQIPDVDPRLYEGEGPERTQIIIAHLTQQCADTGTPPRKTIEPLALQSMGIAGKRIRTQLHIAGALGRLYSVTGRPREGLFLQQEVARELLALGGLGLPELSFPLSSWFRLAGALENREAFDEAEGILGVFGQHPQLAGGLPFIRWTRATAMVLLGSVKSGEAERELQALASDACLERHIRWSACRWLARLFRSSGRPKEAEACRALIPTAMQCPFPNDKESATVCLNLILLDQALENRDQQGAASAIDVLMQRESGLLAHLLLAAEEAQLPQAEYVARYYPY